MLLFFVIVNFDNSDVFQIKFLMKPRWRPFYMRMTLVPTAWILGYIYMKKSDHWYRSSFKGQGKAFRPRDFGSGDRYW